MNQTSAVERIRFSGLSRARRTLTFVSTLLVVGVAGLGTRGSVRAIVGGAPIAAEDLAPGGRFEWLVRLEGPAGARCTGALISSEWSSYGGALPFRFGDHGVHRRRHGRRHDHGDGSPSVVGRLPAEGDANEAVGALLG